MTYAPVDLIHAHLDGAVLCQRDGQAVPLEAAYDPDDDQVITCGECLLVLSGGQEPMGGSRG